MLHSKLKMNLWLLVVTTILAAPIYSPFTDAQSGLKLAGSDSDESHTVAGPLSSPGQSECGLASYERVVAQMRRQFVAKYKLNSESELKNATKFQGAPELELEWELMLAKVVPAKFRSPLTPTVQQIAPPIQPPPNIEQGIYQVTLPIRINVIYDAEIARLQAPYRGGAVGYIRDLLFTTQLYFELPEIVRRFRIHLVVVGLRQFQRDIPANWSSSEIIDHLHPESVDFERADLNLILMRRTLWNLPGGNFMVHMFTMTNDRDAIDQSVALGTDTTVELIGDIEQESALLASEDNDFLIRMGISRKLLTEIMYQQKAVASQDDQSTRRCLTAAEAVKYNVANAK